MNLSFDEVLSTTKAVRQRLDLERPVSREVILECCELANYAPSSRNAQAWSFVFVDALEKRAQVAELYATVWDEHASPMYENEISSAASPAQKVNAERMFKSSRYLRDHLADVPVILFPVLEGRAETFVDAMWQSLKWGSAIPATWSFMLAARSRGLGTCWTSLHLAVEKEMADVIGVDAEHFTQLAMIPVAYTLGTDFKKPPRRDVSEALHWNQMG